MCIKDIYYGDINGVPYKMHCFIEMQFAAHFYTVVSYQALFRLPVYENSAVSKSGAFFCHFARYAISVPQLNESFIVVELLSNNAAVFTLTVVVCM